VLLVVVTASRWSVHGPGTLGLGLYAAGVVLAVGGFGGRLWALSHIGGRKKRELVRSGPYAMCRHPLYLCSLVGGLGLVLATQRITLVLLYVVANVLLMPLAIRSEETFLEQRFPDYATYRAEVPALLPRWSRGGGGEDPPIDGRSMRRGVLECAGFLSPLLLVQLLDGAQAAGVVPFLFVLP
jgi:protein-S-isoprenylcysteine O-methyltransferase Ste14